MDISLPMSSQENIFSLYFATRRLQNRRAVEALSGADFVSVRGKNAVLGGSSSKHAFSYADFEPS